MCSTILLSAFPWPNSYLFYIGPWSKQHHQMLFQVASCLPDLFFLLRKLFLDCLDWCSLLCQQPYALHYLILLCIMKFSILYATSLYSTCHPVFSGSLLPPIWTSEQEWQNKGHLAEEEVVVVLVNKFGLCWCGDFPSAFTCSSQVLLRILSSMMTMTNRLLSIIFIPYLNYGSSTCGFFIFS